MTPCSKWIGKGSVKDFIGYLGSGRVYLGLVLTNRMFNNEKILKYEWSSRPIARFFYWVGAIQLGDIPSKAGGAYLLNEGGGSFGCLRQNCAASLQFGGGAYLECVCVSPETCSPGKFFNFKSPLKWLKMQLKLRWCGETYILSTTKNVDLKNLSPQRVARCSFNRSFNILQATQITGSSMSRLCAGILILTNW